MTLGKTGITWARGWTTRSPTFSFSAPHIKTLNQISRKDSLSPIMSNIFQMLKKKLFVPRTKPLYHFSSYQSWFIPSVSWTSPVLTPNFYQAVSDYPPRTTSSWVSIKVWLSSWSETVAVDHHCLRCRGLLNPFHPSKDAWVAKERGPGRRIAEWSVLTFFRKLGFIWENDIFTG